MSGVRRQCEAQVGTTRYRPYRIRLCPEAAEAGSPWCAFHQEHRLQGGVLARVADDRPEKKSRDRASIPPADPL